MRITTAWVILSLALVACSKDDASQNGQTAVEQPPQNVSQAPSAETVPTTEAIPQQLPPAQNPALATIPADAQQPAPILPTVLVRTNFVCKDQGYFAVQFEKNPSQARIIFPDKRPGLILPESYLPKGFWYKSAGYELRGRGQTASWSEPGKATVDCVTYGRYSK